MTVRPHVICIWVEVYRLCIGCECIGDVLAVGVLVVGVLAVSTRAGYQQVSGFSSSLSSPIILPMSQTTHEDVERGNDAGMCYLFDLS
jgi:hypothetical protein